MVRDQKLRQTTPDRVLAGLCICLVLLLLVAQAVHSHTQLSRQLDSHCSICSLAQHSVILAGTLLPTLVFAVGASQHRRNDSAPVNVITSSHRIRPPPLAAPLIVEI
jgi:hypothetical protein